MQTIANEYLIETNCKSVVSSALPSCTEVEYDSEVIAKLGSLAVPDAFSPVLCSYACQHRRYGYTDIKLGTRLARGQRSGEQI